MTNYCHYCIQIKFWKNKHMPYHAKQSCINKETINKQSVRSSTWSKTDELYDFQILQVTVQLHHLSLFDFVSRIYKNNKNYNCINSYVSKLRLTSESNNGNYNGLGKSSCLALSWKTKETMIPFIDCPMNQKKRKTETTHRED